MRAKYDKKLFLSEGAKVDGEQCDAQRMLGRKADYIGSTRLKKVTSKFASVHKEKAMSTFRATW
jgi:hypothetical protein